MRVSSVRWGVIWLGIGLFFLAINFEVLDKFVFPKLFSLWPILLIAIGIEIIFRRTRFYFLAFISPILIALAFVLAASSSDSWPWKADRFWHEWGWNHTASQLNVFEMPPDSSVKSIDLVINDNESTIDFRGTADFLVKANAEYFKRSPWITNEVNNGIARIQYDSREKFHFFLFGLHLSEPRIEFNINDSIATRISLTSKAKNLRLNFSQIHLTNFNLETKSDDCSLRFGILEDSINVAISGSADRIDIQVPPQFGILITDRSGDLETMLKNSKLEHIADSYRSADLETAKGKIIIEIRAKAKSISIN